MIGARAVTLAPLTTFGIGGSAEYFFETRTDEDLISACAYIRREGVLFRVLGGGSNVLIPDEGVKGLVLHLRTRGIREHRFADEAVELLIEAGEPWDAVVSYVAERGLWGIENLAGIPGTVGGAAFQNIGAYGIELADVVVSAETMHVPSGKWRTLSRAEIEYGYRTSIFRRKRDEIIARITLRLSRAGEPKLAYPDLEAAAARGERLATPEEIGSCVRAIRAKKFPDPNVLGTAGSFFKNPIVSAADADALKAQFPGLRMFPQKEGTVKVALAGILDQLGLKGYAHGGARLFERQPLVIVTKRGACSRDVEALAKEVISRVEDATHMRIEREVETFFAQK